MTVNELLNRLIHLPPNDEVRIAATIADQPNAVFYSPVLEVTPDTSANTPVVNIVGRLDNDGIRLGKPHQ